ncbi:hypothetical protein B0H14DRAFT_2685718, partial [Mycena olivaceomarginata]
MIALTSTLSFFGLWMLGLLCFKPRPQPPLACISFKLFKPLLWFVSHHQTLNLIKTGASKVDSESPRSHQDSRRISASCQDFL